ncbi:MAG: hypothetical protein CVV49_13055 [Spirochaetae bacterium HGW-Spirochaetae-5]|nr:MAG: hypothetical protein CVV49_13055 [Spirochaetae bacterium HGW-Spirochaetae-5]
MESGMPLIKRIFFTSLILFISINLCAEYLFLKDGSIVKGVIISETAAYINFRNEEKKTERYPRDQIMRVLYTELNMGRVFVQRRDGKVDTVYMVDEDRLTYTFRKDLYKPVEFTMKRADVLFMAERNPTGLKGEPETNQVSLEWLPSFEKMKYYNIYYKKKGEKYGPSVKSGKTTYVLKNLSSNTEYTVKVTGFAGDGDETTSSNEYTFVTKNIPPDSPDGINVIITDKGEAKVSWQPASDVDGKVVKYLLFADKDNEKKLIGESKNTAYTISSPSGITRVYVVSVDDRGAESDPASKRIVLIGITPVFTGGVIYPMGKFTDLLGMGYGGTLSLTKHNLFGTGLETGISAGFYYMPGKADIESDIVETGNAFLIPLGLSIAYRFNFTENLSAAPYITGGAAYMKMPYTELVNSIPEKKELSAPGPFAGAGMTFDYAATDRITLCLRAEYGFLVSSTISDYPFMRLEIGAGYRM